MSFAYKSGNIICTKENAVILIILKQGTNSYLKPLRECKMSGGETDFTKIFLTAYNLTS